jgi:polyhydroxybutyrate depolymerase
LVVLNGTEDPIVPYEGGEIRLFGRNRGPVLSTDATIGLWRKRNRCRGEGQSVKLSDSSDDSTRVAKTEYSDCEGDASVLLYRIEGGGHTWPSGTQYLPRALVGSVSRDIDAASEIWAFFSTFQ